MSFCLLIASKGISISEGKYKPFLLRVLTPTTLGDLISHPKVGLRKLCSLICISEHFNTHNKAVYCYANEDEHNYLKPIQKSPCTCRTKDFIMGVQKYLPNCWKMALNGSFLVPKITAIVHATPTKAWIQFSQFGISALSMCCFSLCT